MNERVKEINITEDEYLDIIEDVTIYLAEKRFKKQPTSFELLDELHKKVVGDFADAVYQNASLIEPQISKDLSSLLEDGGAEFTSFEHRLKTVESLRRKIIADSKDYAGSYGDAAKGMHDAVRYTFLIKDEIYIEQIEKYLHQLEDMGYEVLLFKNCWGNPYYQGINVRIKCRDGKNVFELQFHTPMGYDIKEKHTRDLYQVVRDPNAPEDLRASANKLRRLFQSTVKIPDGAITKDGAYEYKSKSRRK